MVYLKKETRSVKHEIRSTLPAGRQGNPKWFDKLTILSKVEGQTQNPKYKIQNRCFGYFPPQADPPRFVAENLVPALPAGRL